MPRRLESPVRTNIAIYLLLCATSASAQGIDPEDVNGRLESLSQSMNAVANECASQRGLLRKAASTEIAKLQERIKELEAKLKPVEAKEKP